MPCLRSGCRPAAASPRDSSPFQPYTNLWSKMNELANCFDTLDMLGTLTTSSLQDLSDNSFIHPRPSPGVPQASSIDVYLLAIFCYVVTCL